MSDSILVPSTAGGIKAWQIGVMRYNNGQIRAYATEVDVHRNEQGRVTGVGYTLFQARKSHIDLTAKRRTEKVVREGIAAMVAKLRAEGLAVGEAA